MRVQPKEHSRVRKEQSGPREPRKLGVSSTVRTGKCTEIRNRERMSVLFKIKRVFSFERKSLQYAHTVLMFKCPS